MNKNIIFESISNKTIILLLLLSLISAIFTLQTDIDLSITALFFSGMSGIALLLNTFLIKFKILKVVVFSTLNGYAIGALNTYFFAFEYWQKTLKIYSLEDISCSIIALDVYSITFLLLSASSSLDTLLIENLKIKLFSSSKSIYTFLESLGLFLSTIQIYLIVSGQVVFNAAASAIKSTSENPISSNGYISFAFFLCNSSPFLIGILWGKLFSMKEFAKRKQYYFLYVMSFSALAWMLMSSRRSIVFGTITILFGFVLTNYKTEQYNWRKIFSLKRLFFVVSALLLIAFAFNFFSYLRFFSYSYQKAGNTTLLSYLIDSLSSYIDVLTNPLQQTKYDLFKESTAKNLSTRTFVFGFLVTSVHAVNGKEPLMGRDFVANVLLSTPSNFFVDKSTVIAGEDLYKSFYNLKLTDVANSYITSAFLDFSWLGLLIYPFAIFLIYNFLMRLALVSNSILPYIILTASLLNISFNGAESSLNFLLVTCRQFLWFYVGHYIANLFLTPNKKI
jgi:uncharacterized membrane protein YidH (DUF202 family)